jgi:hypothetical protein
MTAQETTYSTDFGASRLGTLLTHSEEIQRLPVTAQNRLPWRGVGMWATARRGTKAPGNGAGTCGLAHTRLEKSSNDIFLYRQIQWLDRVGKGEDNLRMCHSNLEKTGRCPEHTACYNYASSDLTA